MALNTARILTMIAILPCVATPFASAADGDKTLLKTFARAIEREPPRYPSRALEKGQEGWVIVSYVVQPDGTVADPIVVESSGILDFERAALKTVLNWSFEPATLDGKPVQQCQTKAQLTFAIESSERGARDKFVRRYNKMNRLLKEGDVDGAESLLDETMAKGEWNLYEYSRLWLVRSMIAHARGDAKAQLAALYKTVGKKGDFVEKRLLAAVLPMMLQLELVLSDYSSALETYAQLQKLTNKTDDFESLTNAVNRLRAILDSEQILLSPAKLSSCDDCKGRWTYEPLRRTFAFDNVAGSLDELELRCDWRLYRASIGENLSWNIPDSWGKCQLHVYGASNTTFDFLEFPEATETQPIVTTSSNEGDTARLGHD
jgi:TonB family protein